MKSEDYYAICPNVDAFINKRTATYIGKISRSKPETFPKKFLTAWIYGKRKNGRPQLTCNNNCAKVIDAILPADKTLTNKQALLKEWLPLATDESSWLEYIENYFNSCRNINLKDLNPEADYGRHKSGCSAAQKRGPTTYHF